MDLLVDALEAARARGSLFARTVMRAPWAFSFPAGSAIQFHAVLSGECELRSPDVGVLELAAGDVAFVAAATPHELADGPVSSAQPFDPLQERVRAERFLEWPGPGSVTRLLCGCYEMERGLASPLLTRLPRVLRVNSRERPVLRTSIALLNEELSRCAPGQQLVVDRLLDTLLIGVLRVWLDERPARLQEWSVAAIDPVIARSLERIRAHPEWPWTVTGLAGEAGLSRATFARRFTAAVGEPAMSYVTRWRMNVAAGLLRGTKLTITEVAERVGYDSPFSFSAAFKRQTGHAPSRCRRLASGGQDAGAAPDAVGR